MKQTALLLSILTAVFSVSCVYVTNIEDVAAEFEKGIEYHNKNYMKSGEMCVPVNVDENNSEPLNYAFSFEQVRSGKPGIESEYDSDILTPGEWSRFCQEFKIALARTGRLATGQMQLVSADEAVRIKSGLENSPTLSKNPQAEGILHFATRLATSTSSSRINFFQGGGYLKRTTFIMDISCVPLFLKGKEKKDSLMPFSAQTAGTIIQRFNKSGYPTGGVILDENCAEMLHHALWAAAIVNTIHHLYRDYPVVGPITDFEPDDGIAVIRAAGDTGVLPEMEFVIYARKKADGEEALRVPLFNATLNELGATGTSTLKIWRKNTSNKTAREIIKSFFNDFNAAQQEYDFFGCCDGLAEWPSEIIDRPFPDED